MRKSSFHCSSGSIPGRESGNEDVTVGFGARSMVRNSQRSEFHMTERRLVESVLFSGEICINFLLSPRADENTFYRPNGLAADRMDCQIGRANYEEFEAVVILEQQLRVTDPIWHNLLSNLRKGQHRDLKTLSQLLTMISVARPTTIFKQNRG
jgi:hypothetical protein